MENLLARGLDWIASRRNKGVIDRAHFLELGGSDKSGMNDAVFATQTGIVDPVMAAAIYSSYPMAFGQIRLMADQLSMVPLRLYMEQRDGKTVEKRTGYPYKIVRYVNPHMGTRLLIRHTVSWLKMAGQFFWAIEEAPPEYEAMTKWFLFPMDPRYVKIHPDPDTGVDSYMYEVAGEQIWFPDNRVIPFRNFSPFDYHSGHSELNPLVNDMKLEWFAKRQLGNYYYNANVIDGVVNVDAEVDDAEVVKLKRQFKEQHEGAKNAHRILVLTKGMKYQATRHSQPESTVINLFDGPVKNDYGWVLGAPPGVFTGEGDIPGLTSLLWENGIQPIGGLIEESLTKHLAQPIIPGLYFAFDYKNVMALRLHDLDRARVEVAHVNAGIRTPNQVREDRDLEPYTGDAAEFGDTPFPKWSADNAASLAETQAEARQGTPEGGTGASPSLPMPGNQGGRDQSTTGEAQMVDETGQRSVADWLSVKL